MLQKLLDEIRAGGTLDLGILAARLSTTPRMVAMMLEDLERMGLLQPLQSCDSLGCAGCDLSGACSSSLRCGRVWQFKNT